jgi:hypothetical protein
MGGGGGGGGGPTVQQQQLETQQAKDNANLNLEENAQRKTILNAMQGTRVFRGSALSRALRGNTNQPGATGAPSAAQVAATSAVPALISPASLLSGRNSTAQNPSASPTASTRFTGGIYSGITAPNAKKPI